MKSKILSLLLLIPIFFVIIAFVTSDNLVLSYSPTVENLILEHDSKEGVTLNSPYKLYAYTTPSIVESNIVWWTEDETKAYVKDGYLYPLEEGKVEVYASLKDGSLLRSFTAYICSEDSSPKYLIINNSLDTKNGLSDDYYYGEYEYEDGKKVPSKLKLEVSVLPLSVNQEVGYNVIKGKASFDGEYVTFNSTGLVEIEIYSKSNPQVKDTYSFNVVSDGVNIYSYEDLLNATNRSEEGDIVVMQTSLESYNNAYKFGDALYPNTQLFGYGKKGNLKFEYVNFESTYDTTFLKNNNQSTTLKMAIEFKKDVYGNGFTINIHEMAYPSKKIENIMNELFSGPLSFVEVAGINIKVSGQDNVGFGITRDGVSIKNINLKNCNTVTDLTQLDYTGTVVEVMADDVTIEDSIISNGRTVVRSFSSSNLVIDNCLLQYAREFILKLGSNSFVRPEKGQTVPSDREGAYNFLSPIPLDKNGNALSDSSCKVIDTYFNQSGFFAIGIDTHFAGNVLYNGTFLGIDFSSWAGAIGLYDLAATSYATHLTLEGDIKIYNWKKVSELDTSTLLSKIIQTSNDDFDVSKYFDIQSMIRSILNGTEYLISEDNEMLVHGGIALFGGGRNLSTVAFNSQELKDSLSNDGEPIITAALDDTRFASGMKSQAIVYAAGYGEFKFYLYSGNDENNLYNEKVNIDDLKR